MTSYVVLGTVLSLALAWVWFTILFPKVREEFAGRPEVGGVTETVLAVLALLVLSAAAGTFIKNRNVLDLADVIRLGFKIWLGFLLPVNVLLWSAVKKSLTALVASAGYFLVTALLLALLADWLLLT